MCLRVLFVVSGVMLYVVLVFVCCVCVMLIKDVFVSYVICYVMLYGLFWCCFGVCVAFKHKLLVWFVCAVLRDVVWVVLLLCVFVRLCVVFVLNVFVCFACELVCDVV